MRSMPLPRWGLPDKGKPDGTHNQVLHFAPFCTTQNQSLPSVCDVVKRKKEKIFRHKIWELEGVYRLPLGEKRKKN